MLALFAAGCGEESDEPAANSSRPVIDADRLTVAATGDIGMERTGAATLEAMGEANADLYLGLGDYSYAGPGSEPEFCELVHSSVGAEAAFEVVSGNHEEDTGEDGRIAEFAKCLPDRAGAEGRYGTEYYFDVGDLARFIMISPDLTIEGEHYYYGAEDDGGDTPNLAWLEQAIDEAHDAGRWVVVGMHKNCISVGEYYCDVYQDLFTALIEHHVDLVLSGHDHSYQRSKQICYGRGLRGGGRRRVRSRLRGGLRRHRSRRSGDRVRRRRGRRRRAIRRSSGRPGGEVLRRHHGAQHRREALRLRAAGHHAGANGGSLRRFHARLFEDAFEIERTASD